ncbi:hypothetical protein L6164_029457 [Bauhinia variegata]|uniref:Uncharacterized protein n=1 Tax=Bauhinia variegata TaxID=167791 RepID=A0ACB9LA48_BAUVA|nr:hypothetical protein L6164_029457 [Bauhinia variegata]
MRINLPFYSSESSLSPKKMPKQDSGHETCSMTWIIENMKGKCLGREKRKKKKTKEWRQQKQLKAVKELSLEEWFSNENKIGFKQLSAGDSPLAARESICFYDFGDFSFSLEQLLHSDSPSVAKSAYSSDHSVDYAFSLEKLLKDEDVDIAAEKGLCALTGQTYEEEKELISLTRDQSCKERKRVSFRLPEASDIIIIYLPDVNNLKVHQCPKHA